MIKDVEILKETNSIVKLATKNELETEKSHYKSNKNNIMHNDCSDENKNNNNSVKPFYPSKSRNSSSTKIGDDDSMTISFIGFDEDIDINELIEETNKGDVNKNTINNANNSVNKVNYIIEEDAVASGLQCVISPINKNDNSNDFGLKKKALKNKSSTTLNISLSALNNTVYKNYIICLTCFCSECDNKKTLMIKYISKEIKKLFDKRSNKEYSTPEEFFLLNSEKSLGYNKIIKNKSNKENNNNKNGEFKSSGNESNSNINHNFNYYSYPSINNDIYGKHTNNYSETNKYDRLIKIKNKRTSIHQTYTTDTKDYTNTITNTHENTRTKNNSLFYTTNSLTTNFSIKKYLQRFLKYTKNEVSVLIYATILLSKFKKIIESSDKKIKNDRKKPIIVFSKESLFRLLTVSLMISTKLLLDNGFSISVYSKISGLKEEFLCMLEKEFLNEIQFSTYISEIVYFDFVRENLL